MKLVIDEQDIRAVVAGIRQLPWSVANPILLKVEKQLGGQDEAPVPEPDEAA